MGRAWNVRVAFFFALLMVIFVAVSIALRAQITVNIAAVVGVLISAAMLYLSMVTQPKDADISSAVTDLAKMLERSWGDRMTLLLGRDEDMPAASIPLPAAVKFSRVTELELTAQPDLAVGGSWGTVYENFYRDVRGGRLVIAGEPGYGKTLLAIELVLQILRARRSGDPAADKLPVPVSVAGWDGADDLATWVTRRLKEEWHLNPVIGKILVQRRLILPVLDGLDEIGKRQATGVPSDQQLMVLRQLNKTYGAGGYTSHVPVIVTCRTDDYSQLKRVAGGLLGAAVVEVQPLDRGLIEDYLLARFDRNLTMPSADGAQWLAFASRMPETASGVLETCMTSPWYLSLAISVCRSEQASVRDLEDFRDVGELQGYLTEASISAAVRLHPRRARAVDSVVVEEATRERQIVLPGGLHDSEDVRRWLTTLAGHLDWQSRQEMPANSIDLLTIWRLAEANGGHPRRVHAVAGITGGILAGLLGGELAGGGPGLIITGITVAAGIGFGLWAGLRPAPQPSRVSLPRNSDARGQAVIALAVLTGILGGIGGQLIGGSAAIGVSEGVSAAFAVLVLAGLGDRQVRALQPRDALRTDLTFGLALGVVYVAVGGLPGGLTGGVLSRLRLDHYLTVPGSIALALIVGMAAGIALGSRCWLRYAISMAIEAAHHRVPLRLERFLDWAYGAGLLRITGVSYQFRHDKLQSSLKPRIPSPRTTPAE